MLRRLLAPESPVQVIAAVTQPDKPVGRAQSLTPPPVKVLAQEHGIPVLQPVSLKRPAAVETLRRLQPDVGIVAAFGKILRADVLGIPAHGYLNVHTSLLPRWRGAWPVGAAILAGDTETGATIMVLDEGMDTGPLLASRRESIRADDTTATLEARLATLGSDLLVETLPRYLDGSLHAQPQDDRAATYCHLVRKEGSVLDWRKPAAALECQVRAMRPWPVASTTWNGKRLNVLRAHVHSGVGGDTSPGMVIPLGKGAGVATAAGVLALDEVQLEGRGPVPITSFLNGYRTFVGSSLAM